MPRAARRAAPPPGERREHDRLADGDAAASLETSSPELLRVEPDQRVGGREAPRVAREEHLVEAREEPVEAEQDERHREDGDAKRRERAREQPAWHGCRSRVRARATRARRSRRARELERRAAPKTERTSCIWASSRRSNAGDPSGSVARSSSTMPSEPGPIDAEARERQRLALLLVQPVAVGREPVAAELPAHARVRREDTEGVDDEHRRDGDAISTASATDAARRPAERVSADPTARTAARSRATWSTRAARRRPRAGRRRPRSAHPPVSSDACARRGAPAGARWSW